MLNITSPPLLDSTGQDIVTGLSNIVSKLDTFHIEADRVSYDNTDSGLVATDVQAAIDRVVIALDTKADKTIIATVESSNTASKNYSTGNLLIKGSVLYRATTEISQGASFIVNTNIEAVTIEELLNEKQNLLTFDDTPLSDSNNPVKSSGIYTALSGKADNSIIATVETSTASKDYAVGDYLILGGILYQVTESITEGSTIKAGVNVQAAVLSDEFSPMEKTVSGAIASFAGMNTLPLRSLLVGIEPVQDLHGYDNPWPAGGGKNKLPNKTYQVTSGVVRLGTDVDETGYIHLTAGTYTVSASLNEAARFYMQGAQDTGNTPIGSSSTSPGGTFTIPDDDDYTVWLYNSNGISASDVIWFQLESGSSATTYAPYSNICPISGWTEANVWVNPTYDPTADPTITLQLGQTVYGGTLDVTNGVLTVTHKMVDMGDLDWVYLSSGNRFEAKLQPSPPIYPIGQVADAICSVYPIVSRSNLTNKTACIFYGNVNGLNVKDEDYNDSTTFTNAVRGQSLVYELATPITIPLTPQEISTLQGQNNLWADSGDVTVTYRAGTNALLSDIPAIDVMPTNGSSNTVSSGGVYDALAEKTNNAEITQVEESSTATRNYTVNSLLILDGILYKATSAIAIGDTITPGTNVIATTISEIIDSILPVKPTTNGSYYLNYSVNGNSINYTWIPRSQWEQFRDVVRSGQASTLYPIGNQLTDIWYQSASTSYNVPWDIVHYSTDKKAYLQWHYTIPDAVAFDQPEALYYFDGTEQPGQYYIQIKYAYGTGWVVDDCISFTLTSQPDKDDQLVIATATSNATDPTDGIAWNVYAKGGSTSKQSGTTSNSSTGTKLGETSSLGTGYTNGKVNSPQRVVYGYNMWSQSAYRQYLNSSYPAGYWWSAQNPWDRPPAVATTLQGFMRGFTDDFLDVVKKSQVVTALNTVEGLSETSEITEDYFFLPSLQQLYVSPQLADVEGEDWDYYKNLATSAGLTGRFSAGVAYPELIKYTINNTSSAQYWRLRSAYRGSATYPWSVFTSGTVNNYYASSAFRCAPACIIS